MFNVFSIRSIAVFAVVSMLGGLLPAAAQTVTSSRLRATIEKIDGNTITVKERSGEVMTLTLATNLVINEVFPIDISEIKAGSFIGSAATKGADGTLDALEVLVFPESMRGAGEGHRPWDLLPESTMTNATVDAMTASAVGRTLKLKYKDGEKTLNVPLKAPIVTFRPGDNTLLVTGAKVMITAEVKDGKPTATRIVAGRNGFAPPM